MTKIHAFSALRPAAGQAAAVASPPYDVLSTAEARAICDRCPDSFLHVVRPEVDMPVDADSHSADAYGQAKKSLDRLREQGALVQEASDAVYVYRLVWKGQAQTGLVSLASVADYRANIVRKHEYTRPDKEEDRADHIETLGAQCGPVFLICPATTAFTAWLKNNSADAPLHDFEAEDEVRHTVWAVTGEKEIAEVISIFGEMEATYVADGHHRSAAASVVHSRRGDPENSLSDRFLTVTFPEDQVRILPYNRVVKDLKGRSAEEFLAALKERFQIDVLEGTPGPSQEIQFDFYLKGHWYRASNPIEAVSSDPVASLDVALLQDRVLAPLLGIEDPRRDTRISFIGGIRGTAELERLVDSGDYAVAMALFATPAAALVNVADSGNVMPPKSTWFEPKLRSGLFVHLLD
jgi:uncharacterized protein (DUF1015 family)